MEESNYGQQREQVVLLTLMGKVLALINNRVEYFYKDRAGAFYAYEKE